MSILPNANFPLLESDQAEVIELFNGLLRERYGYGELLGAPADRAAKPSTGSTDLDLQKGADL